MGLLVAVDVYKGGVPVQHYEFSSDSQRMLRMGKLPSAQVRLDDAAASRIHAVIHLSPTEAVLTDMGAETGTYVNGKRVSKVRLSHGDQIVVGETTLVVGLGATGPATTVTPAMSAAPAAGPAAAPAYATAATPAWPAAASPTAAAPAWPTAAVAPAPAWPAAASASAAAAPAWAARAAPEPQPVATPALPPATSTLPEPIHRLASKLVTLSPESLAEAERYVDWLNARQAGAAGAASHEGLGHPAAAFPAHAKPPRDTNTFIQQMQRSRRTQHLAIAGIMLLVVIVLAVIALRAPANTVPDETGRTPRAAGAPAAPSAEVPPPAAPPTADDQTVVYRLPKDQSPHDLAVELWQKPEHAALLLAANPRLTDAQATLAKDTYVRIPRALLTPEVEAKVAASLAPAPAPTTADAATPTPAAAPTPAPPATPATAPTPAAAPTSTASPAPSPAAAPPAHPATHAAAAPPAASTATPPPAAPPTEPPPPSAIPAPVPEPDSGKP